MNVRLIDELFGMAVIFGLPLFMLVMCLRYLWRSGKKAALWVATRGEEADAPDDALAVAFAPGVTVPDVDGSHDSLPEDKETDEQFWAVAKRVGIEVDR